MFSFFGIVFRKRKKKSQVEENRRRKRKTETPERSRRKNLKHVNFI